jgi:hypothetical protein
VLPHHKQPASEIGDDLQHHSLSSAYNLALVALASTNSVTFSTLTPDFTHPMREDVKQKHFSTPLRETSIRCLHPGPFFFVERVLI